jgi:uncharacterized protein YkwD
MKQLILLLGICLSIATNAQLSAVNWSTDGWPIKQLGTANQLNHLSRMEKDIVLHLNMVRTQPNRYNKEFLSPRKRFYNGKMYLEPGHAENYLGVNTQEGINATLEAIDALSLTSPLNKLEVSVKLNRAAQDHAIEQSKTGAIGHHSSDGSNLQNRIERYGTWQLVIGENIAYGPLSGREVVVELLIDDGVKNRGHRTIILNDEFKVVGVACNKHPTYETVCVIDFAGGMQ